MPSLYPTPTHTPMPPPALFGVFLLLFLENAFPGILRHVVWCFCHTWLTFGHISCVPLNSVPLNSLPNIFPARKRLCNFKRRVREVSQYLLYHIFVLLLMVRACGVNYSSCRWKAQCMCQDFLLKRSQASKACTRYCLLSTKILIWQPGP